MSLNLRCSCNLFLVEHHTLWHVSSVDVQRRWVEVLHTTSGRWGDRLEPDRKCFICAFFMLLCKIRHPPHHTSYTYIHYQSYAYFYPVALVFWFLRHFSPYRMNCLSKRILRAECLSVRVRKMFAFQFIFRCGIIKPGVLINSMSKPCFEWFLFLT